MSSPIHLRQARESDSARIDEIEHLSFIHAGERFTLRKIRHLIRTHRAIVTVAEESGELLGWTAGIISTRAKTPWGRVYSLAIHPRARGRKLGPLLLQHTMDILRARGAGPIFLEVRRDNATAIRLYERFGFVTCKSLPNYYGPGLEAQRMRCDM